MRRSLCLLVLGSALVSCTGTAVPEDADAVASAQGPSDPDGAVVNEAPDDPLPADTSAPAILETVPAHQATSVAVDSVVSLRFSEPMESESVTVTTSPEFALGTPQWNTERTLLTFRDRATPLPADTQLVLMVSGTDLQGLELAGSTLLTFTTGSAPNPTIPTVTSTAPAANAQAVSPDANLTFVFSERMNTAATQGALTFSPGVSCAFSWANNDTELTCDPTAGLAFSTSYTLTLGVAATSAKGVALAAPVTGTFTTAAMPDTTRPTVVGRTPATGAVGVARAVTLTMNFSEPMSRTATQNAFSISPGNLGNGTFSWNADSTQLRYQPPNQIGFGVNVTWQVGTGARDQAGNTLAQAASQTFRVIRRGTLTLTSASALDGYIAGQGTPITSGTMVYVGDNSVGAGLRSFVTFDLSGIPTNVTQVVAAQLSIFQAGMNNDCGTLGALVTDSVDYGLSLETAEYATAILNGRTITFPAVTGFGALTTSVLTKVRDDVTARLARGNRSQFRLRFVTETSMNALDDWLLINAAESGVDVPTLTVSYDYP